MWYVCPHSVSVVLSATLRWQHPHNLKSCTFFVPEIDRQAVGMAEQAQARHALELNHGVG